MVKKKSVEEVALSRTDVIYPRYLSTAPYGEDLFEGKSQEKIKGAIEQYVLNTDNSGIDMSEAKMPRLIGIEGKWGSGKSNVIKMLEKDSALKDNYIFFTYDAWGNQEDLQRKSILYMLTKELIHGENLTGKTKILQYNPQVDKEPSEKECSWEERLQALTTSKSYTREITIPSINNSTKWFGLVLVIIGFIIGILQIDGALAWWLNLLICISPIVLYFILLACLSKDDFKTACIKMFAMYETGAKTDTTSYVICENEPTIAEFKKWMQDISKSLLKGKKLVIVFDNMDRLSKEKVRTLWSSIHTFFADSNNGYDNVWCVIPYDSQHLVNAFEGEDNEKKELLNRFLQKTFPIIYHVPEPIITDYKEVVGQLLHKAFNDTLTDEEYDIINRCYRLTYPNPNVREIIAFINEMVRLYHSWNIAIGVLPIAIYVLQKKHIEKLENGAEKYILDKSYEITYQHVLSSEHSDEMQRNIAALHYGVNPEKAYQIMLKRQLNDIFNTDKRGGSLVPYMSNEEQLSIIEEVVFELDPARYEKAANLFAMVNEEDVSSMAFDKLQKFWNHLSDGFLKLREAMPAFTEYMHQVFEHVSESRQEKCAKHFVSRLFHVGKEDGANIYKQLSALFSEDYAQAWDVETICPKHPLSPEEYINYVRAAQIEYDKYPISSDVAQLNEHLTSLLQNQFTYVEEVRLIKRNYALQPFVDKVVETIASGKLNAIDAAPLLQILRIYYDKFPISPLTTNYVEQLWASVQADPKMACYPEIYALKALTHVTGDMPIDEAKLQVLADRLLFYLDTASLIKKCLSLRHSYLVKLTQYVINENNHDSNPPIEDWIKDWQLLSEVCHVDRAKIVAFATDWGYQLTAKEQSVSIKSILVQPEWVDVLKASPISPLADTLLKKFAAELHNCTLADFIANGTITHTNSYWDKVLVNLIETDYIPNTENGVLKNLVVELIKFSAKNIKIDDQVWLKVIGKCRFAAISTEIHTLRNEIFTSRGGYNITPANFAFLHTYLEKAEINLDTHRNDAANTILLKVIDDPICQQIIIENGDYYQPIISETRDAASDLHDKIKKIELANPESDFSRYLRKIIDYTEEAKENE